MYAIFFIIILFYIHFSEQILASCEKARDWQFFINLPKTQLDGRFPTLNNMGWVIPSIDPYSQEFIKYASTLSLPVLEIGAGYGFTTREALIEGATVVANDLDERHLEILEINIPAHYRKKLSLKPGNFLNSLDFSEGTFGAILAARVFHFLNEKEIKKAAQVIYRWLSKGGKAFIITDSPYLKVWEKFIPIYEERKRKGYLWPGFVENPKKYNPKSAPFLPSYIHFFDPEILSRVFKEEGFVIEKVGFFKRTDYPSNIQLNGKEGVGIIIVKPN